ncbi:hypothetical protein PV328_003989 [Microctonus aethiopoides]|uniref:Uncharacterized protein n=1 Tax=Microctonus aethiopoides TaxID=144406 RepID=A0AA39F9L1_9HYME|nr:hypothetical protein PV328_003989 [Microctonus aethiopoides]
MGSTFFNQLFISNKHKFECGTALQFASLLLNEDATSVSSSDIDEYKLETILHNIENNSLNINHSQLSPSSNSLTLSQDCLVLGDSEIENYICDGTELSLPSLICSNELQNQDRQKESPSKFLLKSSLNNLNNQQKS